MADDPVPTYHTQRAYLMEDSQADPLVVKGPFDEGTNVGDTILVYAQDAKQQWACVIDSFQDLDAVVTRV